MAASFCPRCAAPRTGTLRYCANCAYDFGGEATAGQPKATPPAAQTPPVPIPDWVQERQATRQAPKQPLLRSNSGAGRLLLIGALAVLGIAWWVSQSNNAGGAANTPPPAAKHLTGAFISWEPVDDAHGYAYFSVTNSGTTTVTATCIVSVSNDFGNFGFDGLAGEPVGPGQTINGKIALSVGEGSYSINKGSVRDC